tara:strand:- start:22670 stop:23215 length:546 start_codon:yes stop_codon:yes gene_type:complete
MFLDLKNKGIVLSVDAIGIHNQIKEVLVREGATTILNKNQDTYDHILFKGLKINALVNVVERNCTKSYKDFIHSLYHANVLANDFTMINIGTIESLDVKENSCENNLLTFDTMPKFEGELLNIKTVSIVIPDYQKHLLGKELLSELTEKVAESVAFIISGKSNFNNGQVVFIDKGAHLKIG